MLSDSTVAPSPKRKDERRWTKVETGLYEQRVAGKPTGKFKFKSERGLAEPFSSTFDAESRAAARAHAGTLRAKLAAGDLERGDRTLTVEALAASFIERERSALSRRSTRTVDAYESQ